MFSKSGVRNIMSLTTVCALDNQELNALLSIISRTINLSRIAVFVTFSVGCVDLYLLPPTTALSEVWSLTCFDLSFTLHFILGSMKGT